MTDSTKLLLLGIVGIALWLLCYRFGAIGVRGGGVNRDENPAVYWLGMTVLAFGSLASLVLAFWPTR